MEMPMNYILIPEEEMAYLEGGSIAGVWNILNPIISVIGGYVTLSAAGKALEAISAPGYQPGDLMTRIFQNAQSASASELLTTGLGFVSSVCFMVNAAKLAADAVKKLTGSEI